MNIFIYIKTNWKSKDFNQAQTYTNIHIHLHTERQKNNAIHTSKKNIDKYLNIKTQDKLTQKHKQT